MKIAIDFQCAVGKPTGIGTFAKTLVQSIQKETRDIEWVCYQDSHRNDFNTFERIFWESVRIPVRLTHERPDLIYSPGFAPALYSPVKQVITVHDLIGMHYPSNQGFFSRFYWRRWLPYCVKRADVLVASSEATREDLRRLLGCDPARIKVIPLAVGPDFKRISNAEEIRDVQNRYHIEGRYFIHAGTIEPRKNVLNLLKAFKLLRDRRELNFSIVLAGKEGRAANSVRCFIAENGLENTAHLLGYVPDDDLIRLYNGAIGYVSVSLYEGFGLTALEAMSCGKSGVCSNRSSLPEVVGDTALLVDPLSEKQIAEALLRYSTDASLRNTLEEKAFARAGQFSRSSMARQMIGIFKQVIHG